MIIFTLFILLFVGVFGLPVIAYMITKFGAAGYFRARRRDRENSSGPKKPDVD
jgi:hypothetical protein